MKARPSRMNSVPPRPTEAPGPGSSSLALPVTEEFVQAVAVRAAELVLERLEVHSATASPWLTLEEAAEYVRMSKDTIYKRTAEIPHTKQAGRIRFRRRDLDAWLEQEQGGPAPVAAVGLPRGTAAYRRNRRD